MTRTFGIIRWRLAQAFGLVLVLLCVVGCLESSGVERKPSSSIESMKQSVIYGKDDRVYTDDHPNATLRTLADSVAVILYSSYVKSADDSDNVTLSGKTLTDKIKDSSSYNKKPLCPTEPFRNDPAPGSCTGFLIGKKLFATAGHCISKQEKLTVKDAQYWCNRRSFVFGFKKGRQLKDDDVYKCRRILVHGYSSSPKLDYALIELDREVKGIKPLAWDPKPNLKTGHPIAIIGHPHGTWQKIATGAEVGDVRASTLDYFKTNVDSMPGNSGSPVFSLDTSKVIGIHVRGARPVYNVDNTRDCNVSHTLDNSKRNQSANYLNRLLGPTCQKDSDCDSRLFCDNGHCAFRGYDLQVVSYTLSKDKGANGDTVKATFTFKNEGNEPITTDFRVSLWWSTNTQICVTCGQDKPVSSLIVSGGLAAGATLTKTLEFKVAAPFKAGKQYVGLYLDDFLLTTQKLSYYGLVHERREDNNEMPLPFTVGTCTATCNKAGDVQCSGQIVQMCEADEFGCLGWKDKRTCASGETCEQGLCKPACQDVCHEGELSCGPNGEKRTCNKDANGCLVWSTLDTCPQGTICQGGNCQPVVKPEPAPVEVVVEVTTDGGTGDQGSAPDVSAPTPSGKGGCGCQATGQFPMGGVLLVLLALAGVLRNRLEVTE